MTLGDLYRYSKDEQIFKVFSESGLAAGSDEPIYRGKLSDCTTDLFDEIIDHLESSDINNEIIVVICI